MSQQIIFSENYQNALKEVVQTVNASKVMVLTDEHLFPLIKDVFDDTKVDFYIMEAGEEHKNLSTCNRIWEFLSENNYKRNDYIVNVGGGVVTDLGGFVASTFKRGMKCINFPTSLLAMVDASIGGKTGVDYQGFKNLIGSFYFPEQTVISIDFLKTLPQNELISGFAEVIKHGLIADKNYWEICTKSSLEELDWLQIVKGSVAIKKTIVEKDPKEKGIRKLLNFGHTVGHAFETHCLNNSNKVLHGEAVAIGIIIESYLSYQLGLLSKVEFDEIETFINSVFPKLKWEIDAENALLNLMKNDKKNTSDKINFTLLNGIGGGIYNQEVKEELIRKSLLYYQNSR